MITIEDGPLAATFFPELGMLGTSLQLDGDEYLALPGGVDAYRDRHQTGLPLLAPWANRLAGWRYRAAGVDVVLHDLPLHTDENGLPIHGTMTAAVGWEVVAHERARLHVRFDYGAHPDLLAAFPFPHELEIEAGVEDEMLHVATTLRPTSDRAVPVTFGWHPFLRLPTGARADWRLHLPPRDHHELDGRGIPTGASTPVPAEAGPVGDRRFDDLYELGADRDLAITHGDRRLTLRYGDGYRFAQVFVPPGGDFVCLEPMTAPTNALVTGGYGHVEPGDIFTGGFSIAVEHIEEDSVNLEESAR